MIKSCFESISLALNINMSFTEGYIFFSFFSEEQQTEKPAAAAATDSESVNEPGNY